MSDDIKNLKQTEKEKIADWDIEFATESDVAQIKAEEESGPTKKHGETWHTWMALMLVAFGLLALFSGFDFGFSGWWFLIFLGPWLWGKGSCGGSC